MVIGLTGKSCAGKDEGARRLEMRGIPSIDVDALGHKALEANIDRLKEAFGTGILAPDGSVDRKKLGPLVFSDPHKLATLNSISHPWMKSQVELFVRDKKICTVNAALLEEMDLVSLCDEILYFWAPLEARLERGIWRDGLTREGFLMRDSNQKMIGSSLFECGVRVITILNDSGIEQLYRQLDFYCDTLSARGYVYG